MIILIAGSDNYRINSLIVEIKSGFDDFNITSFRDNYDLAMIRKACDNLTFFDDKKLIMITGASKIKEKKTQSEFNELIACLSPSITMVFIEEEDVRKTNWLYHSVVKYGKVEEILPLKPFEVSLWVKERVKEAGGTIGNPEADMLARILGDDLWRISNEVDKLLLYDKNITKDSIKKLVEPEFLDSVFSLLDAISEKNEKKALMLLNDFLRDDGNEIYLVSMLARQIRNLMMIKELSEEGKKENEIASLTKLHPFVVKNTRRQSKNFSFNQLARYHHLLLEIDLQLKSTATDPKILLFQLIHQFVTD